MSYAALFPWAKRDLLREVSSYTTPSTLEVLRKSFFLSKTDESLINACVCGEGEPVCNDESGDPHGPFCFIYDTCFIKLGVRLPFDLFEKEFLTELNIAPAQLHPKKLGFFYADSAFCLILSACRRP